MPEVAWLTVASVCVGTIAAVLWIFLLPRYDRWWIAPFVVAYCSTIAIWLVLS